MKYKKIFLIILIFNMFLTSCSNFSKIKKNQLVVENINKSSISSPEKLSENKILSEEEAKLKALEALEKYLNIKIYLTEVECYAYFETPNEMKNASSRFNLDGTIKDQFNNSKSVLENGVYNVIFYPQKIKKYEGINFEYYSAILDVKTGEILSFYFYNPKDMSNLKDSIDINEAENIAKEFVEKNNIGSIKNVKFIDKKTIGIGKSSMYQFKTEDSETSSKKVNISINKDSKVVSFSVGIMTVAYNIQPSSN